LCTHTLDLFRSQFLFFNLDGVNGSLWKFTGFYDHLEVAKRSEGWSLLRHLSHLEPIPWLCVGDYNEILSTSEMAGIHSRAQSQIEMFQQVLEFCRLQLRFRFEGAEIYMDKWKARCRLHLGET
jgi:hypothetical protein